MLEFLALGIGIAASLLGVCLWSLRRERILLRLGKNFFPLNGRGSLPLASYASGPISCEQAEREYVATLKNMADAALFSYGFLAATLYLLFFPRPTTPTLFGLTFDRAIWPFISLFVACVTNLRLTRHAQFLSKLVRMYPTNRRRLRFLAFNHSWIANPFRWLLWTHRPQPLAAVYVLLVNVYCLPPFVYFWADAEGRAATGNSFLVNTLVGALVMFEFITIHLAMVALTQHVNLLWRNKLRLLRED